MRTLRTRRIWSLLAIVAILAACRRDQPTPVPATKPAANLPEPTPTIYAPAEPTSNVAEVLDYNLGETTILQDHYPEDSRFLNMPVRLDGVIGVPASGGPFPVVLIMHGSHASCPGENVWPCSPEEEQPNYKGFDYLVMKLAEAGYVTLSINVNAEHTFGFGEAPPTLRMKQLIDLHLGELAAANEGASDKFGLDLKGKVDPTRMTWLGHSRGGEYANRILREQETAFGNAFGEVQGLIQVAPSAIVVDSLPAVDRALVTILPACDQDVINLEGQRYYESAHLDPERQQFATSVYLEGANHNGFSSILDAEREDAPDDRPDCAADSRLNAEEQQAFLVRYAIDFLNALYAEPDASQGAMRSLGILVTKPSPEKLYGYPARVLLMPRFEQRLVVVGPQSDAELSQNLLGGETQLVNAMVVFCPDGYYVPDAEPGTETCKRVNFNQPGFPQQLALSWDTAGAQWRTLVPESFADLERFDALQLRLAQDPLSERNTQGSPQSLSIELVDGNDLHAAVVVDDIKYPAGVERHNDFFEGGFFTGHVHMQTVRIPIDEFGEIDLTNITEITLLFDQTSSGAIFMADLSLLEAGPIIE